MPKEFESSNHRRDGEQHNVRSDRAMNVTAPDKNMQSLCRQEEGLGRPQSMAVMQGCEQVDAVLPLLRAGDHDRKYSGRNDVEGGAQLNARYECKQDIAIRIRRPLHVMTRGAAVIWCSQVVLAQVGAVRHECM